SICAVTRSAAIAVQHTTPSVFCAVTAVTADVPYTPCAANVLRSAWRPAPPLESLPAMVSAVRTGVIPPWSTIRSHDGDTGPAAVEHDRDPRGHVGDDPRRRGIVRDGAHDRRRADQHSASVYAGAVHAAADGRTARRRGARRASRHDESATLSRRRDRRLAGVRRVPRAA